MGDGEHNQPQLIEGRARKRVRNYKFHLNNRSVVLSPGITSSIYGKTKEMYNVKVASFPKRVQPKLAFHSLNKLSN